MHLKMRGSPYNDVGFHSLDPLAPAHERGGPAGVAGHSPATVTDTRGAPAPEVVQLA